MEIGSFKFHSLPRPELEISPRSGVLPLSSLPLPHLPDPVQSRILLTLLSTSLTSTHQPLSYLCSHAYVGSASRKPNAGFGCI